MTVLPVNGVATHVQQLEPARSPVGAAPGRPPADGPGRPRGNGDLPGDGVLPGDADQPPVAVLIHGTANDSLASWYLTLAHPLTKAGLRVIMYDLRGHGRSARPPSGYRLDDFVDDLAALLDTLDVTGPVHLLGNSLGGTIAFGYALRHPERVASIVAIESAPPVAEWMRRIVVRLDRLAARLPDGEALAEIGVRRGVAAVRRAEGVRELLAATTLASDLPASPLPPVERFTAVRCPVLCLYGAESAVRELAPATVQLLPQARTVVIPGQPHSLLVSAPDQVAGLVLPWLREQRAPARTERTVVPN